jgi:hypothetical protein
LTNIFLQEQEFYNILKKGEDNQDQEEKKKRVNLKTVKEKKK